MKLWEAIRDIDLNTIPFAAVHDAARVLVFQSEVDPPTLRVVMPELVDLPLEGWVLRPMSDETVAPWTNPGPDLSRRIIGFESVILAAQEEYEALRENGTWEPFEVWKDWPPPFRDYAFRVGSRWYRPEPPGWEYFAQDVKGIPWFLHPKLRATHDGKDWVPFTVWSLYSQADLANARFQFESVLTPRIRINER